MPIPFKPRKLQGLFGGHGPVPRGCLRILGRIGTPAPKTVGHSRLLLFTSMLGDGLIRLSFTIQIAAHMTDETMFTHRIMATAKNRSWVDIHMGQSTILPGGT